MITFKQVKKMTGEHTGEEQIFEQFEKSNERQFG